MYVYVYRHFCKVDRFLKDGTTGTIKGPPSIPFKLAYTSPVCLPTNTMREPVSKKNSFNVKYGNMRHVGGLVPCPDEVELA